jgi:acylphosphatase
VGLERRIATFSGTVQGVGFRFTACRVAEGFEIAGYVRNLPDGKVEVAAEGEGQEIDRFLEQLSRQMRGYVVRMTQQTAPHQAEFRGFQVRF